MTSKLEHIPVLGDEAVKNMIGDKSGIYIDATFGGGGHSRMILDALDKDGRLIAFDIDDEAIERGKILEQQDSRFKIIKLNFGEIQEYLSASGIEKVNGVVFDLGLSTFQLLSTERGFSFKFEEAPLDMRMDKKGYTTAADFLNFASREKLITTFKRYGEINNPSKLVNNISLFRKQHESIATVGDFLDIIEMSWDRKIDCFKFIRQCFQAIRIEINKELDTLDNALESLQKIVKKNGMVVIITFHSLEDGKIINWKRKYCDNIQVQDYGSNVANQFSLVKRGCIFPNSLEKADNWASRSARLWAFQKN